MNALNIACILYWGLSIGRAGVGPASSDSEEEDDEELEEDSERERDGCRSRLRLTGVDDREVEARAGEGVGMLCAGLSAPSVDPLSFGYHVQRDVPGPSLILMTSRVQYCMESARSYPDRGNTYPHPKLIVRAGLPGVELELITARRRLRFSCFGQITTARQLLLIAPDEVLAYLTIVPNLNRVSQVDRVKYKRRLTLRQTPEFCLRLPRSLSFLYRSAWLQSCRI